MEIISSVMNYAVVLSTAILAYYIYKIVKCLNNHRIIGVAANMFPMEEKHWFWGHLLLFPGPNEEGIKYWERMVEKYPRCHTFWAWNWFKPTVQVTHPETVKEILKTAEPKPMTMGLYKYGLDWVGNGLLMNSGEKWSRTRRLLTPVFHFDNLHKFVTVKNQCVDVFLKKLSKYAESGESIEIMNNLSSLTLDIILRCAFSYENNIQEIGEHHPYMETVENLTDLWTKRSLNPWQHFDFLYNMTADSRKFKQCCKYANDLSDDLIQKRKIGLENKDESCTNLNDFLNVLLQARDEDGNGLSHEEIRAEVNTLMFAGHDTTSTSASWVLYTLALYPHFQKQCQEEIDEMFRERNSNDVSHEDLKKLQYLTCCIKESLRFHTTVPLIERELTKPLVIDGRECPVGMTICPMIHSLHHNETVWSDHMKFDPERFFPENFKKVEPFAFIPFSAGPRNCIGQHFAMNEMKIILCKILHRFTVSLDPERVVKKKMALTIKTENGLYLKISKR